MALLVVLFATAWAIAQDTTRQIPTNPPPSNPATVGAQTTIAGVEGQLVTLPDDRRAYLTFKTPYEYYLSALAVAVLFGGIVVLTLLSWRTGFTQDFARTFTILVIIFAAIFLLTSGFSQEQTAPAYGLFGTALGYIFGRIAPDGSHASGDGKNGTNSATPPAGAQTAKDFPP